VCNYDSLCASVCWCVAFHVQLNYILTGICSKHFDAEDISKICVSMCMCVCILQLKSSVKDVRSELRETLSVLEEELSSVKQSSNKLQEQLQLKVCQCYYTVVCAGTRELSKAECEAQ